MIKDDLITLAGRLSLVVMIAITLNRTVWYQSLPRNSIDFYSITFSISLVIALLWIMWAFFREFTIFENIEEEARKCPCYNEKHIHCECSCHKEEAGK